MLTRRRFAALSLPALAWVLRGQPMAAQSFIPGVLGANTAISGYELFQAIDLIRELGFETIEIHPMGVPEATAGRFPGFQFDRLTGGEKQKIKSALSGFRHVTSHLPYTDLHYLSLFEPVAEFSVRQIDIAIEATAWLGGKLAVLHPEVPSGRTLDQAWPDVLRRMRRWGDMAKEGGLRLALETGFPRSVREFVRLIREIDHDHVGATIDVGHQSRYAELLARVKPEERGTAAGIQAYNDVTHQIIDELGEKVFHLHIHDIEPDTWQEHKPLIHGFVDYPRLFRKLQEIRYQGLLVFEIGGDPERMPGYLAEGKLKIESYLSSIG